MGMKGDGYGCMHGMSDMERASERKVVRRKWSVGNGYA